jgi:hypothetical protein
MSDGWWGFGVGAAVATVVWLAVMMASWTDISVHKEARLPGTCQPGERVLMTTAPKAEYYECEAHWVRK